jgi:murein DD-endopeptidase MepM/ murein hydrolase activator NlpD
MQDFIHHKLGSCAAGLALVLLLLQGCSNYRPLGRGADVPWAKAGQLASVDDVGIRPAGGLSVAQLWGYQHRVVKGDRLSTLARAYGVTVQGLAEVNGLEPPYVIYVGQVLQIPERGEAPSIGLADGDYRVRRGDTLSGLAHRFDVAMVELAAVNRLDPPYHLEVGQRLRVPEPSVAPQPSVVQVAVRSEPQSTPDATDGPPPLSGEGFLWPVNGKLIGGFGETEDGQMRAGIDIAARKGTPVLAAEDGVVLYAADGVRGYGKLVLIRHDEDYITTYAHNSALLVEVGERVRRGQVIARVGDSGDVEDSQLHFELRKGRQPIDPETMLVGGPTEVASSS